MKGGTWAPCIHAACIVAVRLRRVWDAAFMRMQLSHRGHTTAVGTCVLKYWQGGMGCALCNGVWIVCRVLFHYALGCMHTNAAYEALTGSQQLGCVLGTCCNTADIQVPPQSIHFDSTSYSASCEEWPKDGQGKACNA